MADLLKTPAEQAPDTDASSTSISSQSDGVSDTTAAIQDDLDNLITSSVQEGNPSKAIDFSSTKSEESKKDDKKKARLREKKIPTYIMIYASVLIILLIVGSLGFLFYQYLQFQKTGVVSATWSSYMPRVDENYEATVRTLNLQDLDKYNPQQVVTTNSTKSSIVSKIIADEDVNFITKKKVLQDGVKLLFRAAVAKYDSYEDLKTQIGQQGFFPKNIQTSFPAGAFNNSLQKAIIGVESIRFATALKYFSMIDSFLNQLSSYASASKDTVSTKLSQFVKRGEKDINNYIGSCYLNGYEAGTSCGTVGDFSNYYHYIDTSPFDQRLFLLAMDAIESKLENTDFPSLDIAVRDIDPIANKISLEVEINTFKDDEQQLTLNNGILNPHIFLITSVINYLRESRYVLTQDINVNTLQVDKKKVKIGGQTVTVNSSRFSFQLPLQNSVQREIYDFTDGGDDNN